MSDLDGVIEGIRNDLVFLEQKASQLPTRKLLLVLTIVVAIVIMASMGLSAKG